MIYTRKANGKEYRFLINQNIDASLAGGCNWEKGEQ
jgi:hypothetical protein